MLNRGSALQQVCTHTPKKDIYTLSRKVHSFSPPLCFEMWFKDLLGKNLGRLFSFQSPSCAVLSAELNDPDPKLELNRSHINGVQERILKIFSH